MLSQPWISFSASVRLLIHLLCFLYFFSDSKKVKRKYSESFLETPHPTEEKYLSFIAVHWSWLLLSNYWGKCFILFSAILYFYSFFLKFLSDFGAPLVCFPRGLLTQELLKCSWTVKSEQKLQSLGRAIKKT